MSISSIGSTNSTATLQQLFSKTTANGAVQDSDGDNDGSRVKGAGKDGKFASAIQQALAQFGIGGSDTSAGTVSATSTASSGSDTPTSGTQDPQQALQAFAQSLFAAIHAQSSAAGTTTAASATSTGTQTGTQASGSLDAVAANGGGKGHHHHGGGGAGKLESGLQRLIQQLNSGSSASSATASTDSTTGTTSSASSASSDLQTSFNNLLTADGATASSTTLSSFLQALSQKLEGAPSIGNVVNTKV